MRWPAAAAAWVWIAAMVGRTARQGFPARRPSRIVACVATYLHYRTGEMVVGREALHYHATMLVAHASPCLAAVAVLEKRQGSGFPGGGGVYRRHRIGYRDLYRH